LIFLTVSPKGNPALTVDEKANEHSNCPLTIAVEEQVRFTCQTDGIESNPQISTFSFFTGGEEKKTHNSSIWDPVFSLVTDTGSYACTANNNVGPSSFSNSKEVIVQGNFEAKKYSISFVKKYLCWYCYSRSQLVALV